MKKIEIEKTFRDSFLTNGANHTDNLMFLDCPTEFLSIAQEDLTKNRAIKSIKPCCVSINREMEEKLEKLLEQCSDDFQKRLIARDFICTFIENEVLKHFKGDLTFRRWQLYHAINDYLDADFEDVKKFHPYAPMPHDITKHSRKLDRIELNLFLDNTQNIYLQQAINNFISSREPYSVKVFTNNDRLPTYYDQLGNIIQSPHDYRNINVHNFLKIIDDPTDEPIQ